MSLQTLGSNSMYGYLPSSSLSSTEVGQTVHHCQCNITELLKIPEFRGPAGDDGPPGEIGLPGPRGFKGDQVMSVMNIAKHN